MDGVDTFPKIICLKRRMAVIQSALRSPDMEQCFKYPERTCNTRRKISTRSEVKTFTKNEWKWQNILTLFHASFWKSDIKCFILSYKRKYTSCTCQIYCVRFQASQTISYQNALTLMVTRQLERAETFFVKKVHASFKMMRLQILKKVGSFTDIFNDIISLLNWALLRHSNYSKIA